MARKIFEVLSKYFVANGRNLKLRQAGALIIYQDETWIFSGMSHPRDWIDKTLENNPMASYRDIENFTE